LKSAVGEGVAHAEKKSRANKKVSKRGGRKGRRVCKKRNGKRRCRWVPYFSGSNATEETLRAEPLERPSGEVWLYAVNFREEVRANIYRPDGQLDDEVLAQLDQLFRCKRTHEVRAVDPRLYETLSRAFDRFEGQRIELHSGFRFQRNEGSRHYHAAAMDIKIPGVSLRDLRAFAESVDGGGMGIGIYPNAGFVHIDFRAPGEPSYRWRDTSPAGSGAKGRSPSKRWKRRPTKPQS
jgi:uncharacterized protein YcbK (DUF882 family)